MKKLSLFIFSLLGFILLTSCSSISKIDKCFMYIQSNDKDINNWKDFISIIWYNFDNPDCSMDVEIPEKINEIPVVTIARRSFINPYMNSKWISVDLKKYKEASREKECRYYSQECQKIFNDAKDESWLRFIRSVNIPNSISVVWFKAFSQNKIEKVTFWRNIRLIEGEAFEYNNISDITFHPDTENLKIQSNAFAGNDLEILTIPYWTEYNKEDSFDTSTEINYK